MKKTSIGGSALIEGLMMIGPKNAAIAIRKPDGEIIVESRPLPKRDKLIKIPIIRGVIMFFRQMILVMKALTFSAKFFDLEEDEAPEAPETQVIPSTSEDSAEPVEVAPAKKQGKIGAWIDKKLNTVLGDNVTNVVIVISVILSLCMTVGLFILLPNFVAGLIGLAVDKKDKSFWDVVLMNLFEGLLRISFFLIYLWLASKMKEIKRVWQYHGAEHKTIHAYEHGEELTVENIKKFSTKHPRCGTSFLVIVFIMSFILFSFTGWNAIWVNILLRIILIPVVAGLSYEVLKFAGRSEAKWVKIINAPGVAFQALTTKEPDDDQIEVAIAAMKGVIIEDEQDDKW